MNEYIDLKMSISKQKPITVNGENVVCPFCDWKALKETNTILGETNEVLWMENKYPTFMNAYQTVLVEHQDCEANLSTYDHDHRTALLQFAITQWLAMEESGKYRSVGMIKNHGFLSGASIKHSHLQIVGFEEADIYHDIEESNFEGITIYGDEDVLLGLSTKPRGESYEFNVTISNLDAIGKMGEHIGNIVDYILNQINSKNQSFNLVFYHLDNRIIAKIIPRYPTSVYVVGYAVSLLPNNLTDIANDIVARYYTK